MPEIVSGKLVCDDVLLSHQIWRKNKTETQYSTKILRSYPKRHEVGNMIFDDESIEMQLNKKLKTFHR